MVDFTAHYNTIQYNIPVYNASVPVSSQVKDAIIHNSYSYLNCTLFDARSEQLFRGPFLELRSIEHDGEALEQRDQQQRECGAEQVEHVHEIEAVAKHEQNADDVRNQRYHTCNDHKHIGKYEYITEIRTGNLLYK